MQDLLVIQIGGLFGLGLVVFAIYLAGWSKTEIIPSLDFAAKRFQRDFVEREIDSGVIANDAKTALLLLKNGTKQEIGIVSVFGDKFTTRLLNPSDTKFVPHDEGIAVEFTDVTYPRELVKLSRSAACDWHAKFDEL